MPRVSVSDSEGPSSARSDSGSDSESGSQSDSSSAQSIPHDAGLHHPAVPPANRSNYAMDRFVSRISSNDTDHVRSDHVSGRLVDNRAKRKAESDDDGSIDDGYTYKAPRLRSRTRSRNQPARKFRRLRPDDYSEGLEEDGTDDDDVDGDRITSDVRPPPIHPAFPRTAWTLLRQHIPGLRLTERDVPHKLRFLMRLPVKQVPFLRKQFHTSKAQNIPSYLMQATGELLPEQDSCDRCRRVCGVYKGCVVSRDPIVNEVTRGACAGCWYGRQGFQCTLRTPITEVESPPELTQATASSVPLPQATKTSVPLPQLTTPSVPFSLRPPVSAPQTHQNSRNSESSSRKETPVLPPVYGQPRPKVPKPPNHHSSDDPPPGVPADISQMHRAKGSDPAKVPQLATQQIPTVADLGTKVELWSKRYEAMSLTELMSTHKNLMEWNADVSTRLSAMSTVLLKKCSKLPDVDSR